MVKIFAAEAVFHERPSQPACRGIEAFRIYLEWLVTGGQRDMHFQHEQFEQLDVGGDLAFFHRSARFTWRPSNSM